MNTYEKNNTCESSKSNSRKNRAIRRAKNVGYGSLIAGTFASCGGGNKTNELKKAENYKEKAEKYEEKVEKLDAAKEKTANLNKQLTKAKEDSMQAEEEVKNAKAELNSAKP